MNGLPYYKAYPRDFIEGTIGLPFEVKCGYRVVLDIIYMQGGRLIDDPRYISGLLGCSIRKWNAIRSELVALGKLTITDGFISNFRADFELETLAKLRDKQAENARQPRKNNYLRKPSQSHTEPEPEQEQEVREEPPLVTPIAAKPVKARLPDDWALPDEGWAYARSKQIPDEDITDEARGFHAYWSDRTDGSARKSARGWEQCWEGWVRRIAPRYGQNRRMAGGAGSGRYDTGGGIAGAVARRWSRGQV